MKNQCTSENQEAPYLTGKQCGWGQRFVRLAQRLAAALALGALCGWFCVPQSTAAEGDQALRAIAHEAPSSSSVQKEPLICPPDPSPCGGDCNGDKEVTVDEVVRGVGILLGLAELASCPAADRDGNEIVTVDELVESVRHLLYGCNQAPFRTFLVRACSSLENPEGETFFVRFVDPEMISLAERIAAGKEPQRIVTGRLRCGDGGFNRGWSWHLDPNSTSLVEASIELCDGCPSFVEAELDYWLRLGRYCPWSTEILRPLD